MIKSLFTRLVREEEAASATEYAILVAVIAGIVLAASSQFDLGNIFATASNKVKTCVNAAGGSAASC